MSLADAFRLQAIEMAIEALKQQLAELRLEIDRKANKPGRPRVERTETDIGGVSAVRIVREA